MPVTIAITDFHWLREVDSNYRPLGYEPNELPTAPPRDILKFLIPFFYLFYAIFIKNITSGRQMDGKNNFLLYYNFLYKIYNACKYYASWWLVSSASLTDFWVMSPTSCQLLHPAMC